MMNNQLHLSITISFNSVRANLDRHELDSIPLDLQGKWSKIVPIQAIPIGHNHNWESS